MDFFSSSHLAAGREQRETQPFARNSIWFVEIEMNFPRCGGGRLLFTHSGRGYPRYLSLYYYDAMIICTNHRIGENFACCGKFHTLFCSNKQDLKNGDYLPVSFKLWLTCSGYYFQFAEYSNIQDDRSSLLVWQVIRQFNVLHTGSLYYFLSSHIFLFYGLLLW